MLFKAIPFLVSPMARKLVLVAAAIVAVVAGAALYVAMLRGKGALVPPDLVRGVTRTFTLSSPAFRYGEAIPTKYAYAGENKSPPLLWSGAPDGVAAYVLIVYDPDAPGGTFYHWLLYDIPTDVSELPEGVPRSPETEYGLQGRNDFGNIGYDGPHPPLGSTHRYVFLLLALDEEVELPPGAGPEDVLRACEGHVIAYAELIGIYAR